MRLYILISWSFTLLGRASFHSNFTQPVVSDEGTMPKIFKTFNCGSCRLIVKLAQTLPCKKSSKPRPWCTNCNFYKSSCWSWMFFVSTSFSWRSMHFLLFQEIIFFLRIRQPIVETNLRSKNCWSRNRWLSLGGTSPRRSRSTTNWWLPRPVAFGRMIIWWMMFFFLGGKGQFWDLHDL